MLVSAEQEAQLTPHKLSFFAHFCLLKKDQRGVCGSEASFPESKRPLTVTRRDRFADRTSPTASEPLGALYNNATGSPGPTIKLHTRAF